MRNISKIVIAAALAAFSLPAFAADLPLKAPPAPRLFYAQGATGWYVGILTEADVAKPDASGTNLFATSLLGGGLTATGGSVGIDVGYIGGNPNFWYRLHATGAWANISATNAVASTPTSSASAAWAAERWSATQEVDVGFEVIKRIYAMLPALPTANFPVFTPPTFSAVNVGTPFQYVGFVLKERGVAGGFGNASGTAILVAPGLASGFIWEVLDASGKPTGGALDAQVGVAFAMRGFQVNNVFAANGVPLTVNSHVNMGNEYWARLTYMFALR